MKNIDNMDFKELIFELQLIEQDETMFGDCKVCPQCGAMFSPQALFVLNVEDLPHNNCCLEGLISLEDCIENKYQVSLMYNLIY